MDSIVSASAWGDPAIVSLRQAARELAMPLKTVRTLIIEHGIPFEVVGRTWVISAKAYDQLKAVAKDHLRKSKAMGIEPRRAAAV